MTPVNSTQGRVTVRARIYTGRSKQTGLTLIEVLIALVLGLLALYGVFSLYQSGTTTANNQGELENVTSLITSIRTLKTASGYGASGTNLLPVLINSGGVPGTMSVSGNAVTNVWNGAVTAVSTGAGFTLTYADVPKANCNVLATKSPTGRSLSVSINGGSAISGEVSSTAANAGCSTDANTLAWSGR
jgi:prepilin-type N-terminal cleavage/methylation domain-containing protein